MIIVSYDELEYKIGRIRFSPEAQRVSQNSGVPQLKAAMWLECGLIQIVTLPCWWLQQKWQGKV